MTGVYLSGAVIDRLADAQVVIDMHVAFSRRGVCALCEEPEPCDQRDQAQALIVRYGGLPRRTPMLTLATPARSSPVAWFDGGGVR